MRTAEEVLQKGSNYLHVSYISCPTVCLSVKHHHRSVCLHPNKYNLNEFCYYNLSTTRQHGSH